MRLNNNYKRILKIVFLICVLCFSSLNSSSNTNYNGIFDSANSNYSKGNYEKAIELYESILNKDVEASELYFNLGNAYYKTNRIGLAILHYEKAKKISPNDDDIENNLKLANLKTEDKIDASPRLFLSDWINEITNLTTERNWSITCIGMICLSLLLFSLYFLSVNGHYKKVFFYSASFFLFICIASFFIAKNSYVNFNKSKYAIIIVPTTTINSSPALKSTQLFILHEGTKVTITNEEDDWFEIKLANGNVGWIYKNDIGKI